MDDGVILGGKVEVVEGPLVIPLEGQRWVNNEDGEEIVSDDGEQENQLYDADIEPSKMEYGLIIMENDTKKDTKKETTPKNDSKSKLPPILRNRPKDFLEIEDENEKFKYDVESRPDIADAEAYERVPLEQFGEAMLRGMGWAPGTPIGLNSTECVPVTILKRRPNRLGLGAKPKLKKEDDKNSGKKGKRGKGEKSKKEKSKDKSRSRNRSRSRERGRSRRSKSRERSRKGRSRSRERNRTSNRSRDKYRESKNRKRYRSRSRERSQRRKRSRSRSRESKRRKY
eukprot:TRINITY_DN1107_c1_g1_i2.p1 TRINITY_DN1107_c1_g1~~TRINITY_DN1107_c1_g1_i2.p1  ORF type:complete len:284 (-),score=79.42 TRINITY_DN1107_c1_g1_i2:223-1074(-)